jgi:fatty-acid desaturase
MHNLPPLLLLRRFLELAFLPWLLAIRPYLMYTYLGGWSGVVWSIAVPMVITWHSTFLVNSAAHVYGRRPYETGTPAVITCNKARPMSLLSNHASTSAVVAALWQ